MFSESKFYKELDHLYSREEIRILLKWISETNSPSSENYYQIALDELKLGKPIQYILGECEFYGLNFKVNNDVLIPRPETEELVDLIIGENKNSKINILDIGTGSGCIAITLQKKLPLASVSAMDISENALALAKENALLNNVEINFLKDDALQLDHLKYSKFDVIVSNPPYIANAEKNEMSNQVLDFEPHLALFVEDIEPLIFYDKISGFALSNLSPKGKLYFEINQNLSAETLKLLLDKGFTAEIIKDINGNDRIISAQLLG
jgi:release factor glutamine methyltransferase